MRTLFEWENRDQIDFGRTKLYVQWHSVIRPLGAKYVVARPLDAATHRDYRTFSSVGELEEFAFACEQYDINDWWFSGGETPFWRITPDGEELPPPDFSEYGYRAIPGRTNSNYWWIVPTTAVVRNYSPIIETHLEVTTKILLEAKKYLSPLQYEDAITWFHDETSDTDTAILHTNIQVRRVKYQLEWDPDIEEVEKDIVDYLYNLVDYIKRVPECPADYIYHAGHSEIFKDLLLCVRLHPDAPFSPHIQEKLEQILQLLT